FQEMTLVKRYLAKAIFEPTFRDLHLKVEAISKNAPRSLAPYRDDNNRPPLSPRGGNGFAPPFNKKRKYILLLASPTGRFGGAQSNILFTSSFSVTPSCGGRGRWLILL
ncbi:hypothetical protein, partial [Dysgonomonas sp. 25]|uniref:hypothetical protein n=1 Tax=Dysgonomonas sp. 25 TaxID=2302933 RepID=UPI001C8880C0